MKLPNGKFSCSFKIIDVLKAAVRLDAVYLANCDFCLESAEIGYKTLSNDVFYCCDNHAKQIQ